MATKKASPAQLAARKLFAARAKAGTLGNRPVYVKPTTKKTAAMREKNPIKKKAPSSLSDRAKSLALEMKRKEQFSKSVGYYPRKGSPDYELVALFSTHSEAVSAATMYAQNHPAFQWFVKGI